MRRRGNKSHKVPNVKLRPAQESQRSREESPIWVADTQASDDTSILDTCPRPFKGVVVCATGVTDKPTLFKQALELGAIAVSAFTDKVTHLLAEGHGGAKYSCALERKIPIMKPSWVTESYQIWLRGDDVDYEDSIKTHRLPIFSGVILCPSGIQDITRRTQIHKLITQHGGQYLKNLERPVKVTHLLCSGDTVTDKMRYAEKFNERGEANIYLIWEEWFWDSLEFGGRFEEGRYAVSGARPERKVLSSQATVPSILAADSTNPSQASVGNAPAPFKPQRSTTLDEDSFFDEEIASVNVVPAVTMKVWTSLLGRRGYEVAGGQVVLSPTKEKPKRVEERPPSPTEGKGKGRGSGVISAFRRANSFAPTTMRDPSQSNIPFRRATTNTSLFNAAAGDLPPVEKVGEGSGTTTSTSASGAGEAQGEPLKKIFAGLKFRALGEAKSASVRSAIEQGGGLWERDDDDEDCVDFIVVRLVSGSKIYRAETDPELKPKYRTECWLERCIFEERICEPEDHISFVPFDIVTPVRGAERLIMSISGFGESDAVGLKRLIRGLGISLAPSFSRKSSYLLCECGEGLKFEKAKEWGVPVVNVAWLAEMKRSGKIPGVKKGYEVGAGGVVFPVLEDDAGKGKAPAKGKEMESKGKGKAKASAGDVPMDVDVDVAGRITDITNTSDSQSDAAPLRKRSGGGLERNPTVIIPDARPMGDALTRSSTFSFGHLDESLLPGASASSSFYNHPSSVRTPAYSPVIQYGTRLPSAAPSAAPSAQASMADLNKMSRQPSAASRKSSAQQSNADAVRVGSSRSPSPMKLRGASTGRSIGQRTPVKKQGSRLSLTPVKIDKEATRALEESITSLLGKRSSEEAEGSREREKGKRARPTRTRPQTRQPSVLIPSESGYDSIPGPRAVERTPSVNPFDTSMEESMPQERGARVTYEDPAQADERKRLMDLLRDRASVGAKAKEKERDEGRVTTTRRSQRLSAGGAGL